MTNTSAVKQTFVRRTVTIPAELADYVEQQRNSPQHAGNLSSFVRSLVIADRAARGEPAKLERMGQAA
jgi:Arc/MetJ-type ribon-helix-helix transcriptional regulator